jgi:hypothetical protein
MMKTSFFGPDGLPTRRTLIIGLACGGTAIGAVGAAAVRSLLRSREAQAATRESQARARPHIEKADTDSLAHVDGSLRSLEGFFGEAKGHAKAFADDVLGWYSKYKLVRGQHEQFLAETFRKHFFGPEELRQAMTNAVEAYVAELEAIDNRMLVDIRMDVAGLPAAASLSSMPMPDLQARYREVCGRIGGVAGADLTVDAGRAVADLIVGSVVTMIAARMGTSAVVVGAAAASSWWTFGIGLVIGVIIDQIIATVWDWTYDPRGKLVAMMGEKIDEVRKMVLEGDGGKPGLRAELRSYAERRAALRREAVMTLLADTKGDN